MQENYGYERRESTTGLIYLRPEQIRCNTEGRNVGKKAVGEQNAIIRISESMKRYGVLQPLSVRLVTDMAGFPAYELVDGARRLRAARLLGLDKLPCVVVTGGEKNAAIAAIVEEVRRKGVHFLDQAAAFRRLSKDFGLTQEEIARKTGVSQSAVANKLRLLRLSAEEQRLIRENALSERHARALLRLKDPQLRGLALAEILREEMTVGCAEALIEAILSQKTAETGVWGQNVSRETFYEAGETQRIVSRETIGGSSGATEIVSRETILGDGTENVSRETISLWRENRGVTPVGAAKDGQMGAVGAIPPRKAVVSTVMAPETPPQGICPRKFVLHDLRPLYNSIERTLSIFRKTGQHVDCRREESADGVRIIIEIPHRA